MSYHLRTVAPDGVTKTNYEIGTSYSLTLKEDEPQYFARLCEQAENEQDPDTVYAVVNYIPDNKDPFRGTKHLFVTHGWTGYIMTDSGRTYERIKFSGAYPSLPDKYKD